MVSKKKKIADLYSSGLMCSFRTDLACQADKLLMTAEKH